MSSTEYEAGDVNSIDDDVDDLDEDLEDEFDDEDDEDDEDEDDLGEDDEDEDDLDEDEDDVDDEDDDEDDLEEDEDEEDEDEDEDEGLVDEDQLEDEYEEGDINRVSGGGSGRGLRHDAELPESATSVAVLTYIAKALSSDPESVVVQPEAQRNGVRLRLHVSPSDMGRIIGRRGRTAQAIRTLVGVAGAHDGVSATVDIVDD